MAVQKLSFLVIDDDPGDIQLLRRHIEPIADWQVEIQGGSPRDCAKAKLSCSNFDLIFIDYRLGKTTGIEIFEEMKKAGCTQPKIMLTGQGNEMVAVEAMKKGFADYLIKDKVDANSLRRAVSNALEKAALKRQILAQQKQLEDFVRTDMLTGLYSRRYFLERLYFENEQAKRYRHPISILMLDLDHFKKINDTFGHLTGDYVLAKTGEIIREQIRNTDIAGRYGGEEFCFILCNTGMPGAREFSERMREAIASFCFSARNGEMFHLTCSIGLLTFEQGSPLDITTALDQADKALYQAKKLGRNRVCEAENS